MGVVLTKIFSWDEKFLADNFGWQPGLQKPITQTSGSEIAGVRNLTGLRQDMRTGVSTAEIQSGTGSGRAQAGRRDGESTLNRRQEKQKREEKRRKDQEEVDNRRNNA